MNDTLIIVICIFLMSILWTFYFKNLKEGVDNYVMPISFSDNSSTDPSRDESKTINVPGQINSSGDIKLMKNTNVEGALNVKNNLDIRGITNLNGEIKIPNEVPIHFGAGENKQIDAGKISYGSYGLKDNLSIVGAGNAPRRIRLWDDVSVASNLKVEGNTNTNTLNVIGKADVKSLKAGDATVNTLNLDGINIDKDSLSVIKDSGIKRIEFGICSGEQNIVHPDNKRKNWKLRENNYGNVKFKKEFDKNENIYIFTTRNGGDTYESVHPHECSKIGSINVFDVNTKGFNYRTSHVNDLGGFRCYFSRGDFPFFWVAFSTKKE